MKTFTYMLLAAVTLAGKKDKDNGDDENIMIKPGHGDDDKMDCVCCGPPADKGRLLCINPSLEDEMILNANCEEEEGLDACIERIWETDPKNTALAELKEIRERTAEHEKQEKQEQQNGTVKGENKDGESKDDGKAPATEETPDDESGAFNALSVLTALAATIAVTAF